jgi:hypothetical protein
MAVMAAILIPVLIGLVALAIDCGYLLQKRADLQRAADASALAAVRELVPDASGTQDFLATRAAVREYARANLADLEGFEVLDADIELGRYDPETIYSEVTLLDEGTFDAVRVTLRRDASANGRVPLFFGGVFGMGESEVRATATAVLQKASALKPGAGVLPFTIPEQEWEEASPGDTWNVYGDGQVRDASGKKIPGNWGTCDLGNQNNSTADLRNQILHGLRQKDLDALHADGRIPQNTHIDSHVPFQANGDPGLSAGMKHAVEAIHGQKRLIPIVDEIQGGNGKGKGGGNNLEYRVTGWAVCQVVDSTWKGSKNTQVRIMKSHLYDGALTPNRDLSDTEGTIEGAYTTPALVE